MRQSIQLLGMSTKDLSEYIESILEKNPCLRKEFQPKVHQSGQRLSEEYETTVAQDENPRLLLLSQVRMQDLDDKQIEVAEYIIYELDENGYLSVDIEEIASELGIDASEVDTVLEMIQGMEPPGIGARNVQECLQLQLKRMGKEDSLEYAIITAFMKELASEDVKTIAKELKASEASVNTAIKTIKKLNPRPASSILGKIANPVIPDMIAQVKDDKVSLGLNRDWLPRLKLYNPYEDKLDIIKDPEVRDFLKENMQSGRHLIDNLKRREDTMCKVADYILNYQVSSLSQGRHEIKTLTIKDVASALKLHPSTISRTVSSKYVQIDGEVMPLSAFLSNGMRKMDGKVISKTAIKKRIEEMVKTEDKTQPLNDDDIVAILEMDGIAIKRRTAAKYRSSLRILPAHLRKKSAVR